MAGATLVPMVANAQTMAARSAVTWLLLDSVIVISFVELVGVLSSKLGDGWGYCGSNAHTDGDEGAKA